MGNLNYKNENIERKNQFLKTTSSLLELEKDREVNIKPIIVSMDDMAFEQKEMKKISPIKNNWCNWLINYIPELISKSLGSFKDKVISLFKTNTLKQTVYGRGKKLNKSKT